MHDARNDRPSSATNQEAYFIAANNHSVAKLSFANWPPLLRALVGAPKLLAAQNRAVGKGQS